MTRREGVALQIQLESLEYILLGEKFEQYSTSICEASQNAVREFSTRA